VLRRSEKRWRRILDSLLEVIPVYEKMNVYMSLGIIHRLREKAAVKASGKLTLDLGSGPGSMTKFLAKYSYEVVMLDPLPEMLKAASPPNAMTYRVVGVGEALPFRPSIFDSVVAAFSLRDVVDLATCISETHAVLREGGKLVVLELRKSNNRLWEKVIGLYWSFAVPLMAFIVARKSWKAYKEMYRTYSELPRAKEFLSLLKEFYADAKEEKVALGAAHLVTALKG